MDSRGLVRLEWPREHKYIAVGLSLADDDGEPHDDQGGPPPVPRPLRLHATGTLRITHTGKGGGLRDEPVSEDRREAYVGMITEGLNALGYTITLEEGTNR